MLKQEESISNGKNLFDFSSLLIRIMEKHQVYSSKLIMIQILSFYFFISRGSMGLKDAPLLKLNDKIIFFCFYGIIVFKEV